MPNLPNGPFQLFAAIVTRSHSSPILWRKEIEQLLGLPNPDATFVVQKQRFNGCSTGGRETGDLVAVPAEVVVPMVRARIEERNCFLAFGNSNLDTIQFVQIAAWAGPGEIVELRWATG